MRLYPPPPPAPPVYYVGLAMGFTSDSSGNITGAIEAPWDGYHRVRAHVEGRANSDDTIDLLVENLEPIVVPMDLSGAQWYYVLFDAPELGNLLWYITLEDAVRSNMVKQFPHK